MSTVTIAELKAHLSAEIKKVRAGESVVILDHRLPAARIVSLSPGLSLSRKAARAPCWVAYEPLMKTDSLSTLEAERADSW